MRKHRLDVVIVPVLHPAPREVQRLLLIHLTTIRIAGIAVTRYVLTTGPCPRAAARVPARRRSRAAGWAAGGRFPGPLAAGRAARSTTAGPRAAPASA